MKNISRRSALITAVGFGATTSAMVSSGESQAHAGSPRKFSTRVIDLVRNSLVIDMLSPLRLEYSPEVWRLSQAEAVAFRESGITCFHNSVGIGGSSSVPAEDVLRFIAFWQGFVAHNPEIFSLVGKISDIDDAKSNGRCAVIIGLQNSVHFRKISDVKLYYAIGQRVSQLTYNVQNLIGSGCTEREDGGLSDFGVSIVNAMNEVGMLVDTSHCGDRTTLDAISLSPVAIAITHSNCRALTNNPRNKTDDAIRALAAKGGVMGITGVSNFVSATEPTTIGDVVDHIDHVARLVGIEHVGIGTDSDLAGYDNMSAEASAALRSNYKSSYGLRKHIDVEGFSGPLKMYSLVEELVRRSYSDHAIRAVIGGNFHRLLGSTWK